MIVGARNFQVNILAFLRPDTAFTDLCLLGSQASSLRLLRWVLGGRGRAVKELFFGK